ncbi:MAG: lysylphosphatidylglycerol synthase transmembrane domain-containing protein [bacterium]
MSPRKLITGSLLIILSIALLVGLLSQIHFADLLRLAEKLHPGQVLLLFGLYAGANVFRAIRLGCVLNQRNYLSLTAVCSIHLFLNHILPFRTGELSLPLLLKTFNRRSLATGTISLVVVRLYDMISIVFLMIISLAVVRSELQAHHATAIGYALIAVTTGVLAVFFSLPLILQTAGQVLPTCGKPFGATGDRFSTKLVEAVYEMRSQLQALRPGQRYFVLPLTSLLTQACIYSFFYFSMRYMGIDIGFFKNLLASSGELITGLLPVNMVGSLGTLEAGWAVGYVICGIDKVDAIATGFIVHGLIILSGLMISVIGLTYLLAVRRAEKKRE